MNPKDLRIIFMGTQRFGSPTLRTLVEKGYNVVGVVTGADKPSGRGQKVQENEIKTTALELGLHILQPESLRSEKFITELRSLLPDLGVVIAFRMLPEQVWSMPCLGTINLHGSLLPQYRGAAPVQWAIINGETQTGITTFRLRHEIDTGDIIGQTKIEILPTDNFDTLYDRMMHIGVELMLDAINKIATGSTTFTTQFAADASVLKPAPKIFKEDCLIDWSSKGKHIVDLVRGIPSEMGAWTKIYRDGETSSTAKIFSASFESADHNLPCGDVASDGRTFLKVACSDGFVSVGELQTAGKKRMETRVFLSGFRNIGEYSFSDFKCRS